MKRAGRAAACAGWASKRAGSPALRDFMTAYGPSKIPKSGHASQRSGPVSLRVSDKPFPVWNGLINDCIASYSGNEMGSLMINNTISGFGYHDIGIKC